MKISKEFNLPIYEGDIIYLISPKMHDLSYKELHCEKFFPHDRNGKNLYHLPIKDKEGIEEGNKILVYDFKDEWLEATVKDVSKYSAFARIDKYRSCHIIFSNDERQYWICEIFCYANPEALKKIRLGKK